MKPKRYPIHVRFNDIDAYGIVNNAVYITFFEEGRKLWFNDRVGEKWDWISQGIVLAHHEVDYILPIAVNDDVEIELRGGRIGSTSFDVHYKIFKKSGGDWELCTTGKSVLVCFNYKAQRSVPIPEKWLALLKENSDA